jgi:hypothetical protein
MAGETDQTLLIPVEPIVNKTKCASGVESNLPAASSSSNMATVKIENKTISDMSDYWKKTTITEDDRSTYHTAGWLGGELESIIPTVEYATVDGTTEFASNLIWLLGLDFLPVNLLLLSRTSRA